MELFPIRVAITDVLTEGRESMTPTGDAGPPDTDAIDAGDVDTGNLDTGRIDDAELIRALLTAPDRFAELFRRHADAVGRYLARRIGTQDAEDVLADTFLEAGPNPHPRS